VAAFSNLDRFERALGWWATRGDAWPTSSLTGGGAIAELEALLARTFGGRALALPSGSSAIRAGLRVLGIEPGKTVALVGSTWFGATSLVESAGGTVALTEGEADFVLVDVDALAYQAVTTSRPLLIDAANLSPEGYARLAACHWDALALSFGPGKPIDAGEAGALVVREHALYKRAVQLTQHPLRQQLTGLTDCAAVGPCERIHPVAALTALHELSIRPNSNTGSRSAHAARRPRKTRAAAYRSVKSNMNSSSGSTIRVAATESTASSMIHGPCGRAVEEPIAVGTQEYVLVVGAQEHVPGVAVR
jgi:dTDP-4-amino-4,6-dideoxygalactose transaminase